MCCKINSNFIVKIIFYIFFCSFFRNLSEEDYRKIREGMIRCILATDMARHNEILSEFREVIPVFSFDDKSHVNLVRNDNNRVSEG